MVIYTEDVSSLLWWFDYQLYCIYISANTNTMAQIIRRWEKMTVPCYVQLFGRAHWLWGYKILHCLHGIMWGKRVLNNSRKQREPEISWKINIYKVSINSYAAVRLFILHTSSRHIPLLCTPCSSGMFQNPPSIWSQVSLEHTLGEENVQDKEV